MNSSIVDLVDNLPKKNVTVKVLNALDLIVPGKWENIVGFDQTIQAVTKVTVPQEIQAIREKAIALYNDPQQGYQTAVWIYQTIDNMDQAIAAAALADKVGDTLKFIPFLDKLTPKADQVQTGDFSLKLIGELVAYSKMNQITLDPAQFATSLKQNYQQEALLRMVALICFEGLLPLGSDFIKKIRAILEAKESNFLQTSSALSTLNTVLPVSDKQQFILLTLNAVQGWMENTITQFGLTPQSVCKGLSRFVEIADDQLDYVAAFLDASTNYYEHTGIQTVARNLILNAYL